MFFGDDDIEDIDGYEELGQNVIDQAVVYNSQNLVPSGGEQLSVQPTVGPAATEYSIGEKNSALITAWNSEEFDEQVEMFKAELNAKQSTLLKAGTIENGTLLSGSDLFNSMISGNLSVNPDLMKEFSDKVQYNFEINIGPINIAIVPSILDGWEADNGFYLLPDDFGIDRKFKNGIMVPEDQFKVEMLHNAYNNAINTAIGSTLVPTASTSVDSGGATDSPDTKKRINMKDQISSDGSEIDYKADGNIKSITTKELKLEFKSNNIVLSEINNGDSSILLARKLQGGGGDDMIMVDPNNFVKFMFAGTDGIGMTNEDFNTRLLVAFEDYIHKDVIPTAITDVQKISGVIAKIAGFPAVSGYPPAIEMAAAIKNFDRGFQFPAEVLKNMSIHYDESDYTYADACIEAGKTVGVDLVKKEITGLAVDYIAKELDLGSYAKWLLKQGVTAVWKKYPQ